MHHAKGRQCSCWMPSHYVLIYKKHRLTISQARGKGPKYKPLLSKSAHPLGAPLVADTISPELLHKCAEGRLLVPKLTCLNPLLASWDWMACVLMANGMRAKDITFPFNKKQAPLGKATCLEGFCVAVLLSGCLYCISFSQV